MNTDKARKLIGALVSTRAAASGNREQGRQIIEGELVELSSRFALPRDLYSTLEGYDQKGSTVAAVAAGAHER